MLRRPISGYHPGPAVGVTLLSTVDGYTRWVARPWLSRAFRVVATLSPVLLGSLSAIAAARVYPPPGGAWLFALWALAVTGLVGAVTVIMERAARKVVPFAFLLRLGVVFPDRVPSRFSMALRSSPARDLERAVSRGNSDSRTAAALLALVARITAHDRRTRGHSERVRAYTELLGRQMSLDEDELARLRWASLLHDVGKVAVPGDLLNKYGPLDGDELEVIRRHPDVGRSMIEPVAAWLGPWAAAVAEHHERWDGTGYPHGVAGSDISLGARIVSVADAYEVMVSGRLYRMGLDENAARRELVRCAGTQFDPAVVRAFLLIPVRKLRWATGVGAWLGELPYLQSLHVARTVVAGAAAGVASLATTGATVPHAAVRAETQRPAVVQPQTRVLANTVDAAARRAPSLTVVLARGTAEAEGPAGTDGGNEEGPGPDDPAALPPNFYNLPGPPAGVPLPDGVPPAVPEPGGSTPKQDGPPPIPAGAPMTAAAFGSWVAQSKSMRRARG